MTRAFIPLPSVLDADGPFSTNAVFLPRSIATYPEENLHLHRVCHDSLPIPLCNPFCTGDGDSVGAVRFFD